MCRVRSADPGELAQRVRLLVGQPAAAEDGDRVPAVRRAWTARMPATIRSSASSQLAGRSSPAGRVAHQRGGQPVRVVEQFGGGPALLAQPAPVGGELAGVRPSTRRRRPRAASCRTAARSTGSASTPGLRPGGRRRAPSVMSEACRGRFPVRVLLFRSCQVGLTRARAVSGPGVAGLVFGPVKSPPSHRHATGAARVPPERSVGPCSTEQFTCGKMVLIYGRPR